MLDRIKIGLMSVTAVAARVAGAKCRCGRCDEACGHRECPGWVAGEPGCLCGGEACVYCGLEDPPFWMFKIDETVDFAIRTGPKESEMRYRGVAYPRYLFRVEADDGMWWTLSASRRLARQIEDLVDHGFPRYGRYRITRRGYGLKTRYTVIPLPSSRGS